jgi:hypothetical protein
VPSPMTSVRELLAREVINSGAWTMFSPYTPETTSLMMPLIGVFPKMAVDFGSRLAVTPRNQVAAWVVTVVVDVREAVATLLTDGVLTLTLWKLNIHDSPPKWNNRTDSGSSMPRSRVPSQGIQRPHQERRQYHKDLRMAPGD